MRGKTGHDPSFSTRSDHRGKTAIFDRFCPAPTKGQKPSHTKGSAPTISGLAPVPPLISVGASGKNRQTPDRGTTGARLGQGQDQEGRTE